jgi:hypothetical protein
VAQRLTVPVQNGAGTKVCAVWPQCAA